MILLIYTIFIDLSVELGLLTQFLGKKHDRNNSRTYFFEWSYAFFLNDHPVQMPFPFEIQLPLAFYPTFFSFIWQI